MKKYIALIVITSVFSLIGTFSYIAVSAKGVSYTPGISTTEMDSMSYTEASTLMAKRAHKMSAINIITTNITELWFLKNVFQLWIIMVTVSLSSFFVANKYSHSNTKNCS